MFTPTVFKLGSEDQGAREKVHDASDGELSDGISELGDEDPGDIAFAVGQKPKELLQGEALEQARRDAKFKVAKKNGGRFSKGSKGGNQTKKINKYGHRVKGEKISDMM